jgi:putative thioredoxin
MEAIQFNFQRDVIDASFKQPVVVDFWAAWCAPCRILGPVLEKLDKAAAGRWRLVKVNTEEQPHVAASYKIRSIPAVKMFVDGKVIAEFVGALPESTIVRWLTQHLPTESKKAVDEAHQLIKQGNLEKAKNVLAYAIEQDETNTDAKIMLAALIFEERPEEAVTLVRDFDESHKMFDQVSAIRTLARLRFEQVAPAETNGKAWDAYTKGIEAYRQKNYGQALEQWIDAIMYDRKIDKDGPRRACVSLFRLLGSEHELTKKYHRQFTSALY